MLLDSAEPSPWLPMPCPCPLFLHSNDHLKLYLDLSIGFLSVSPTRL